MDQSEVARLIGELEAEVNNGGFDQFFFNSAGNEASEILEALDAVGATRTAEIVRRACSRFAGGMPPKGWTDRQEELTERVSPDSDAFDTEDEEFFAYEDDLAGLVAAYSDR